MPLKLALSAKFQESEKPARFSQRRASSSLFRICRREMPSSQDAE